MTLITYLDDLHHGIKNHYLRERLKIINLNYKVYLLGYKMSILINVNIFYYV